MATDYQTVATDELKKFLLGLTTELQELSSGLDSLIHDREQDFLDLGARLMEFTTQSTALSEGAGALVELCSGERVEGSIDSLAHELDGLQSLCALDTVNQDIERLDKVFSFLQKLESDIEEFGRIIRKLQVLGISTRIESARLGEQGLGFSTLADDVEALASKIVADSSAIGDKSKSVASLLDSVRKSMVALGKGQQDCSSKIMGDLHETLDDLRSMMDRSQRVAEGLSQRSSAVADNVAEVVSSLQFHDIVRQQVEHVEEALQDMGEQVSSALDEQGRMDPKDVVGWIADVSELQVSQLNNAVERFSSAVEGLRTGLSGIADTIDGMRADVGDVFSTGDGDSNVFEKIDVTSKAVLETMGDFAHKTEEIAGLVGTVAQTVSEMSEFVGNIEEVGAEIELIAINASIKAAHTGEEGKALGVLAQAIQSLSMEARERTSSVSNVLVSISDSSVELRQEAAAESRKTAIESYADQQRELSRALNSLQEDMMARMRDVDGACRGFSNDVKTLASSIHFDEYICPGLEDASRRFVDLGGAARELVPLADDVNRAERLEQMLSRYTMEMERIVHEAAFGSNGDSQPHRHEDEGDVELFGDDMSEQDAQRTDDEGDDWDNVDLF